MPAASDPLKNRPNLNEVLIAWKGPSHPFKKRDKTFYQTVGALTFLFTVIVFFLHEFLLIGVILSIAFVVYVLATIPPFEVEHKVTPLGFDHAGRLFSWNELSAYWFEEKWGQKMIVFHTRLPFPVQVRAVLKSVSQDSLKEIVGKHLLYLEKPPKNWSDSFSTWLSTKFPLDIQA